jgi:general secretion pathway protein G
MKRAARPVQRQWQRGASLLELAVAAIVTVVLAGVLLNSIINTIGESERVATKQVVGAMRTALAVESARIISTTGVAGLIALSEQNPMGWLRERPKNYLGEYYSPKKDNIPSGNWYFDRNGRVLVYRPANEKSFSDGIQKILVFKVELARVSSPHDAGGQGQGSMGLVLRQLDEHVAATTITAGSDPRFNFSEKN